MERGTPNQTIYTFEAAPGQTLRYPDDELWTRDYREADAYANKNGYLLIANEYEFEDSNLVEDYAPPSKCKYCNSFINESDTGLWEDPAAGGPCSAAARNCDESSDHLHYP